ncbi:high-affinity iron transporter [Microbulbifer yueqingensis]|uniref:High-affinity iron transporter n=1 Tax=Microbulbifer yueqingensis TaxID=658219 RepID=A0A1G9C085_9GAMM|nr:high-affinity iron transporter [Microbulbifer yueqingensis]
MFLFLCATATAQPDAAQPDIASRVARAGNLLSYVAADYAEAVRDGQVIDDSLYRRQRRNLAEARELLLALPERPGRATLESRLADLQRAMAERRDGELVRRSANAAADRLAALYQLQRSPVEPLPAPEVAQDLYVERCAGCHGTSGEGASGPRLDDYRRMAAFSLYDLYSVLDPEADPTHGRPLAGDFSSRQRWALAVTVAHFAVADKRAPAPELAQSLPGLTRLPGIATTRPLDLPPDAGAALMWWRGNPHRIAIDVHPLERALGRLQVAETAFRGGDAATAYYQAMLALREDYLPLEERLLQRDPALAGQLTDRWQSLRTAILADAPNAETIAAFRDLRTALGRARERMAPVALPGGGYIWLAALAAVAILAGLVLWLRRRR